MSILAAGQALVGLPLARNNFGDNSPPGVAGPLGLVVIILLAIATGFLIRNMNRRLRRLPDRFDVKQESDRGLPRGEVSRQDRSHQNQTEQGEAASEHEGDRQPGATSRNR